MTLDLRIDIAETILGRHAQLFEELSVLLECALEEDFDAMAEHHRIRDFHHGRLEVQGEEHPFWARLQLFLVEVAQGRNAQNACVDHLSGEQRGLRLQNGGPAGMLELDANAAHLGHDGRLLASEEVARCHVRHMALGVSLPSANPVWMLLRKLLDRRCASAVRVPLAQNGIHGAAKHLRISGGDVDLLLGLGIRREIWNVVSPALKLRDRGSQLRHGRRDVRQLDDVGCRALGQLSEHTHVIFHALLRREVVRKAREDPSRQGYVLLLDFDAAHAAEGAKHRQQGVGGQHRGLVGVGVCDLDVRNADVHIMAVPRHLVQDAELSSLGQVVQPLRKLHCAVLVEVELTQQLAHVRFARRQVQVLQGRLKFFGAQAPAAVAVVAGEGLGEDGEFTLRCLRARVDNVLHRRAGVLAGNQAMPHEGGVRSTSAYVRPSGSCHGRYCMYARPKATKCASQTGCWLRQHVHTLEGSQSVQAAPRRVVPRTPGGAVQC
mmetsp:Transcript_30551/g.88137  ORF Transcript_30551/g.88137 Transcript_30551/m.88137 type:complete len:492 (-) Transcript_30551:7-1482(-)